jgi:hypothetical protein
MGNVLLKSCLKKVALSFVLDGSFGDNDQIIGDEVARLSGEGREVHLHLYVYNGPAQRRWESDVFKSFAVMDPLLFREKLRSERRFQQTFSNQVSRISPLLQIAKNSNARVTLAPAVEDNLDDETFGIAIALIRDAIPADLMPTLVRSPCSDCAIGNEFTIPAGVAREKHTATNNFVMKGGIVVNDGEFVRFKSDRGSAASGREIPLLNTLTPLLRYTGKTGNKFILWIPKYQDTPADLVPKSPEARTFRKPTRQEERELINFLRTK